jgi:hypothetical protein
VNLSPFRSEGIEFFLTLDGAIYIASKHNSIMIFNKFNGKVLCHYEMNKPMDNGKCIPFQMIDIFKGKEQLEKVDSKKLLYMIKTDYSLNSMDTASSNQLWNLTYSEFFPTSIAKVTKRRYSAYSTSNGVLYSFDHYKSESSILKFDSQV